MLPSSAVESPNPRSRSRSTLFIAVAVEEAFQSELPPVPALPQENLDFASMEGSFLAAPHDSGLMSLAGSLGGGFEPGSGSDPFVTDGSLNRRTGSGCSDPKIPFDAFFRFAERRAMEAGVVPRLHVVGFELGELERDGLGRLAKRFGGSLRDL